MPRVDPLGSILPYTVDDEAELPALPREHPQWVKDAPAVSHRARHALARLRPPALRVLTFWDHRVHTVKIGLGRLTVDASGSYRLD